MMDIEKLKSEVKAVDAAKAIDMINEYLQINPNDDEALTMRGMTYWSLGQRSNAINDYLAAIKINPQSRAKMAIKTAYEILNFYNKDLFNP